MTGRRLALPLLVLVLALGGCGGTNSSSEGKGDHAVRPVTLALDFQPNAVHAGILEAADTGIARRHGLKLGVRVPAASTDSLKLLLAGRADYAVMDIHDLGIARERGTDVVGIGAVVQRPLAAVIAGPKSGVRRPRELEGKRVGVTGVPSDTAVLDSVVRADGGDPRRVKRITIGFAAVPSLAAGKVDAVVTFWNAEGVALRKRGVRTREFRVDRFGAPAYPELVVVARRESLRRDPERARELVAALRDGTKRALADPAEAAQRVVARGGDKALTSAQLRAVAPALNPPLALRRAQLEGWAAFDARFGILKRRPDVKRAFWLGG